MKTIKLPSSILSLVALGALTVTSTQAALIGYWPLDESSANFTGALNYTVADTSGNNQSATNVAHANVILGAAGKVGTAATFNYVGTAGVGKTLAVSNMTSLNGATRFTLTHWFKPVGSQAGATRAIISSRSVNTLSGLNQNWATEWFLTGANRRIQGRLNGGATGGATDAVPNANTDWLHVALVYDGAVRRVYTNGVESANGAVAGVTVTNTGTVAAFVFGGDPQFGDRNINGTLDDIAMWNEAFTPDQIYNVYTNGVAGISAKVAYESNAGKSATLSTWSNTGGANWSTGGNWTGGTPNAATAGAKLANAITGPSTVNNDAAHTVNSVFFDSTNSYTIGGASTLTFAGSVPAINVQRGSHTVTAPIATSGSALDLNSAGDLIMGSQSYADNTIISGLGTVSVSTMDNGGSPSGIGASSSADTSLTFDGGTLRYTGSGHTTDRSFRMGASWSTIDASGSGALVFNSTAAIGFVGSAGAETLRLTGSSSANNTIALSLGNTVAPTVTAVSLLKTGSGRWVFGNAANAFTGATTVSQGTLALSDAGAITNSPTISIASGATLEVSAVPGYTLTMNQTLQGSGTVSGNLTTVTNNIRPGGTSAAGTLTVNGNLTLNEGATYFVELSGLLAVPSDKIVVNGDLVMLGTNKLSITGLNPPVIQTGTYTLMEYTGTITGDTNNFTVLNTSFYTMVVSIDTINKRVNLDVSGTPPLRIWSGDGILNPWNTTPTVMNWATNAIPNTVAWVNGASALFNDDGNNASPIVGSGTLQPGSLVFSNTAAKDYVLNTAAISGSVGLLKLEDGDVTLNAASTYTGGTVISNGTIKIGNNNALSTKSSPTQALVQIRSGATLDLNNVSLRDAGGFIEVVGTGEGGNGAIIGGTSDNNMRRVSLTGNTLFSTAGSMGLRGDAPTADRQGFLNLNGFTLTKRGSGSLYVGDIEITNSGNIVVEEGVLRCWGNGGPNPFGVNIGGPGSLIVSNGASFLTRRNGGGFNCSKDIQLYGTLGQQNVGENGGITFDSPITLYAGYNFDFTADTWTFRGPFIGAVDFDKDGASTFRLEGTNTYTGNTLITGGTLLLATNGSIATSPIIEVNGATFNVAEVTGGYSMASGQTLRGDGAVTGNTTVPSGTTLSPGVGGVGVIGTLTNGNTLTLAGNTAVDVDNSGPLNDQVAGAGARNFGGTLTVNNLGAPFVIGNTFTLFPGAGARSGNFASIVPANPNSDPSLSWGFDPATGVLRVGIIPTPEPLLATNVIGGIEFSWTNTVAWKLQAQTNTLNVGITTNWYDYPGGTTPPVTAPVVPGNPAVFYRLKSLVP